MPVGTKRIISAKPKIELVKNELIPFIKVKDFTSRLATYNFDIDISVGPSSIVMDVNICQFCFNNGEAKFQYQSHSMKNPAGKVTCPVLRSYKCPICQATGDFAHTQRYCPLNKYGKFNRGASLTELKKKKNAAGSLPGTTRTKKLTWPLPSHLAMRTSITGKVKVASPNDNPAPGIIPEPLPLLTWPLPRHQDAMRTWLDNVEPGEMAAFSPHDNLGPEIITEPLPLEMRPRTPPPVLPDQPECAQLTMYRHHQYLQYYR